MRTLNDVCVSDAELRILNSVREQPPGELRELYLGLLLELAAFLKEPSCAEVQADGIPCDSPAADCTVCLRLEELLRTLRSTVASRA